MKIALAMIVRGADDEADVLKRCLANVAPHVDGIFITRTHKKGEEPNEKVKKVAEYFGAHVSEYEWTNDFAHARNFNWSQVPKEYDYILWADADDVFRGLENLRTTIAEHPLVDAFSMWYLYHFDEHKQADVVHMKTMIVKNNGCVEWAGKLHEDFREFRNTRRQFIKGIERLHLTDDSRLERAKIRNVEVSRGDVESNPNDPRSYWNYGQSLFGTGEFEKARDAMNKFIEMSSSDEEKYIVLLRLSELEYNLKNPNKAIDHCRYAIGMKPEYPDAYHTLGKIYHNLKKFDKARDSILMGLTKKPPYYSIIVFNPRAYDYEPLMLLAKTYFSLSNPAQALVCLKACLKIYPEHEEVKRLVTLMQKEADKFEVVVKECQRIAKIKNKKKLKEYIDKLDPETRAHPMISLIHNTNFIKTESSGKDLTYYCGYTQQEWNPESAKTKKVGGSEEAVINLSKEFAKLGWNVTVYNNCGLPKKYDGVQYRPFWEFNFRDKQDVVILWRHVAPVDYGINAGKIFIDLHDVINPGEFTEERLAKVTKIFVKTKFHRDLYEDIPDNKFEIVPNGMDFGLFKQKVQKDQYLLVNTSSPDRSMDVLPKLFKRVKEQVPEAKCKWAYGWEVFDTVHSDDPKMMEWKSNIEKEMAEAGIENLGGLSQKECAKLYLEGNILAYPTEFAEIDCITVKKAQACGAIPVTTNFGALEESVQYGVKIPSLKNKNNWSLPGQFSYGMETGHDEWVDAVVKILKTPLDDRKDMKAWTKKFEWSKIATSWHNGMVA